MRAGTVLTLMLATQLVVDLRTSPPAAAFTQYELVSVSASNGSPSGGFASRGAIDAGGTTVAFESTHTNLVAVDGNGGTTDVFARDLRTGVTELVSLDAAGGPANGPSGNARIPSGSGFVLFDSTATDLVDNDTNGRRDVFRRNLTTDTTHRVSQLNGFGQLDADSHVEAISPAGTDIAFSTTAAADPRDDVEFPLRDVYLAEMPADGSYLELTWVSRTPAGGQASADSFNADVSSDGSFVVFQSSAGDLVTPTPPGSGELPNIYLWRSSPPVGQPAIVLVSHHATGTLGSVNPQISDDGSTIVYTTTGDPTSVEFPDAATFTAPQVVAYDVATDRHSLVSISHDGAAPARSGVEATRPIRISPRGDFVAFESTSPDLVVTDPNGTTRDAFILDTAGRGSAVRLGSDAIAVAYPDLSNSGDGSTAVYETTGQLSAPDANAAGDVYVQRELSSVPIPAPFVDLSLDRTTVPAGAENVPIADIPAERVPLGSVEVGSTPLRSVDIAGTPLRSVPLRSVPLRSVPLRSVPLRSVPLRSVGGWAPFLEGTPFAGLPLEAVSLGEVLDHLETIAGDHPLKALTLQDIDLEASPLRSVGLASIALGATPLRSVPLRSVGIQCDTTADPDCEWKALLAQLGLDLTNLPVTIGADTTLLALDVAGVPLRSVPLRSVPLRSVDLSAAPLRSVPLRSVAIGATPLRSVPLRSVPLRSVPLRSVPLRSVDDFANQFDCAALAAYLGDTTTDCGDFTLGQAEEAGAILQTALLGMLTEFGDTTIGDLAAYLPPDISLGDILIGLLLKADYPWEEIPIEPLGTQDFAPTREEVGVTVETSPGDTRGEQYEVIVTLPERGIYAPGSATIRTYQQRGGAVGSTVPLGDPVVDGRTLRWTLTFDPDAPVAEVALRIRPGLRLEDSTVQVDVGLVGNEPFVEDAATYTVTERREGASGDDLPSGARPLGDGDLVVGHLGTAGDVDHFRIQPPAAGQRVSVALSGLSLDGDVVLFRPSTVLNSDSTSKVPVRVPFVPADAVTGSADAGELDPEVLADIAVGNAEELAAVSAKRGTEDEVIELGPDGSSDPYLIQVSAFNGGSSDRPYVIRVRYVDEPAVEECDPAPLGYGDVTTVREVYAAPDLTAVEHLFVVNRGRTAGVFDPAQADAVMEAVNEMAGAPQATSTTPAPHPSAVAGHVIDVGPATEALYDAWDQAPCSPYRANDVVDGILEEIDLVKATLPNLRSITLVGGDLVVPSARVPDLTTLSNERDYSYDVGAGNALSGAFVTEHLLSDDPYADGDPIPVFNRRLYVPDLALGRLVETPDQIVAAIDEYLLANGVLVSDTAVVTGYDFLTDGANAVGDALQDRHAVDRSLIREDWTADDLAGALFPAGGETPHIASVNAHFDHYRSLPAHGNATHDETDLFTIEDIPGGRSMAARLIFSMGCHSGLSVDDRIASAAGFEPRDWPQTFADAGAVYVGNTGFGYGDTAAVALSERLMTGFAQRIDTMSVGEALTFAKQAYVGQLGAYGPYDEKVMAEATLYGLPMWRLETVPTTAAAEQTIVAAGTVGPVTSGDAATITVTPGFVTESVDGRTFDVVAGEAPLVIGGRPIQPQMTKDVTVDGKVAKGVVIQGLESTDRAVDAAFARPLIDVAQNQPAIASDSPFPGSFAGVNRYLTPDGPADRLVLVPGQFLPDDDPGTAPGTGTQRRFTRMDVQVLYGDEADTDWTAPRFRQVTASVDAGTVRFVADLVDEDLAWVEALYHDSAGWHRSLLVKDGDGYVGTGPTVDDRVSYLVQAVDVSNNVGVSANKDRLHAAYGDTTPPSIDVATPHDGIVVDRGAELRLEYACVDEDGGSGLHDCEASAGSAPIRSGWTLDTGTLGTHAYTVRATDMAGNETLVELTYRVVDGPSVSFVAGSPPRGGWYRGRVDVEVTGGAQPSYTIEVDGVVRSDVEGTGVHEVVISGGGFRGVHQIRIDDIAPTVTIDAPSAVDVGTTATATASCADADSGVEHCSPQTTLFTSTAGTGRIVTMHGRDVAGNAGSGSATYDVLQPRLVVAPDANDHGWHTSGVTLSVADGASTYTTYVRPAAGGAETATDRIDGDGEYVVRAVGATGWTSGDVTVRIDATDPVVEIIGPDLVDHGTTAEATVTCEDGASCPASITLDGRGGTLGPRQVSVTATAPSGRTGTATHDFAVVEPSVWLNGAAPSTDWYREQVAVTVTGGALGGDYVVSQDGTPRSTFDDGVHTVIVSGANGYHRELTFKVDTIAPTATAAYTSTVDVGVDPRVVPSCDDAGSGVVSCEVSEAPTTGAPTAPGGRTFEVTATDAAGHTTTESFVYHVVQPTIAFSGTAGNGGWFTSGGTVSVTGGSSPGYRILVDGTESNVVTDDGFHTLRAIGLGSDGEPNGFSAERIVAIDATAPTLTVDVPAELDQGATTGWSWGCTDTLSGIASCTPLSALDTSVTGDRTLEVAAVDVAGNRTTRTVTYRVLGPDAIGAKQGFLSPVRSDVVWQSAKHGSTVPLKWRLWNRTGSYLRDTATFVEVTYAPSTLCSSSLESSTIEDSAVNVPGVTYDLAGEHFVLPFKTTSIPSGCQRVTVHVASGGVAETFSVILQLR